jgi:hypothetical protein
MICNKAKYSEKNITEEEKNPEKTHRKISHFNLILVK